MCCRKEWTERKIIRWAIDALHWYIHRHEKKDDDAGTDKEEGGGIFGPPPDPPGPQDPTRGGA